MKKIILFFALTNLLTCSPIVNNEDIEVINLNIKDKKLLNKDFSDIKPSSYDQEIDNFITNLKEEKKCSPSISDALEVMRMIDFVYSTK